MPESVTPRRPHDDPHWEEVVYTNPTKCHKIKDRYTDAECEQTCRTLGKCMLSYRHSGDLELALKNTGATGDLVKIPVDIYRGHWRDNR